MYILKIVYSISSCILAVILLTDCSGNVKKNDRIPIFELTGNQYIANDSACFRYPFRLRLFHDSLYIMDLHGSDYYVHCFSFPQMHILASYGRVGSGPKEMLDCENIRIDHQGHLWMLDANKKRLVCISDTGRRKIALNHSLIRTLDFDFYNDSLFIVPDYTGKCRYNLINSTGDIIAERAAMPGDKKHIDKPDIARAQAWRSFIDYNPDNGILAMVTQLGEVVELYDARHDSMITTIYGKAGGPVYSRGNGIAVPKGIMGYSDVQVGSDCIYALFWGQSFRDIRKGTVSYEGGNRIDVFDLHGTLVRMYRLDRHVTGFQIDETKKIILALDPNHDQPLVSYQLKDS